MRAIHRPRGTLARSALSLVLLLALATAGYAADRQLNPETTLRTAAAGSKKHVIKVSGKTKGLYPGATKRLKLKIKNPQRFAILVRKVTAKTKSPGSGCSKKSVKVKTWKGKKKIKAHKTAKVKTKITMRKSATDACQGVRFKLTYGGKAVKA